MARRRRLGIPWWRSIAAGALAANAVACGVAEKPFSWADTARASGTLGLRSARSGPDPFAHPDAAADLFVRERLADGEAVYPIDALRGALEEIRRREQVGRAMDAGAAGPAGILGWRALGPGNIGGRTRALAIDPQEPEVIYAGGVSGGVWKSSDGGATWQVADDLMLNLAVSTLAVDPVDPGVVYAGTGEGFFWPYSMARGLGIFRSTDRGATWSQLEGTVTGVPEGSFHYVHDLAISTADHHRLYAATRFGVWRSDDDGDGWTLVLANSRFASGGAATLGSEVGCTDVALVHERSLEAVLAACGVYEADGLYRSVDAGKTWALVLTHPSQGRMSVAVAPSDPDVVYVSMAANSRGELGKLVDVYRSADGGESWQPRVDMNTRLGPWLLSNSVYATRCARDQPTYHQGWYDNVIAVDPLDADTVWVGGIDLFRSQDGGRTFHPASLWWAPQFSELVGDLYVHADHHALVFHPRYNGADNQVLYSGSDGGLARTDNAAAASTAEECPFTPDARFSDFSWVSLNNGYEVTQFYHGDSARDADRFVGGSQDNGTSMVTSRSAPNSWRPVYGGDGGYVAFDPRDSDTFYVEREGFPTIAKTTDGGAAFAVATTGITDNDGLFIAPFAMDPSNPDILWTGGSRPWRTTNGAASWVRAGGPFGGQISAIAVAPSDGNVVFMGLAGGGVARTRNGLSASPQWSDAGPGLATGWVSSLAVDPHDPERAYCTISTFGVTHVYRTDNGGQWWDAIDGVGATGVPEIPVHWIAVRPCDTSQLYLGTELGVFASDDRGATWRPANHGLAHTVVEALDFKDDDTLVAFTRGRGAFLTELAPCSENAPRRAGGRVAPR